MSLGARPAMATNKYAASSTVLSERLSPSFSQTRTGSMVVMGDSTGPGKQFSRFGAYLCRPARSRLAAETSKRLATV